ncbi:MAG: cytochrome c oxidase assembly protein subunit 11 [Rhodospirillaceae bacterium]|nr:MAG: cytochrome c oxidase assembly protein subunit 11 [Rhodospirillaceae bacterium]
MERQKALRRRKILTVAGTVTGIVAMIGVVAGAVPFYRWFCQASGYGGTPKRVPGLVSSGPKAAAPTLTVRFDANIGKDLPWSFTPAQGQTEVRPGESVLAVYIARNMASVPVTGTATFNVTPAKAGPYFNKIACFCFREQTLAPGEEVAMPVTFVVDPAIATDPTTSELTTLTLSYTFFRSPGSDAGS